MHMNDIALRVRFKSRLASTYEKSMAFLYSLLSVKEIYRPNDHAVKF